MTTSVVTFANLGILAVVLRRRIGRVVDRETWRCLGLVGVASLPLLLGGWALAALSDGMAIPGTLAVLGLGGGLLGAVYVVLLLAFKLPEASGLLDRFTGRLRRKAARSAN
jgi:hypothetical protein